MTLIKCPECGKEISNLAESCIHCGYPLKSENEGNRRNDKKENKSEPDFLTQEEKDSGFFCVINAKKHNIVDLLDEIKKLNPEDYDNVIEAALYGKNLDANVRLQYLEEAKKTKEGLRIFDITRDLVSKIRKQFDLVIIDATEFLYQVLINGNKAPEEFHGKSASEDRRERDAKMEEEMKYQPKCPTCGSPDIEKLRKSETSGSIFFFGNIGFANELAGKTYRCRHCKYTW